MTHEQALNELNELRGLADTGTDLAIYDKRVRELYWAVCHKTLRKCKCRDKYKDALIEIYIKLNKSNMNTINAKARLVNGVVLFWNGKHYSNNNITDDVARAFLAKFPQRKNWFADLPPAPEQKAVEAVVAEKTENDAEIVSKAVKPANKATTPKKKKSPKKRK